MQRRAQAPAHSREVGGEVTFDETASPPAFAHRILPATMIPTLSPSTSASSMLCVVSTMQRPLLAAAMRSHTWRLQRLEISAKIDSEWCTNVVSPADGVQAGRGLVEKNYLGIAQQRHGD